MADLTTTAAVKAFLGITTSAQDAVIASLITAESDVIARFTGRTFPSVPVVGQRFNGNGRSRMFLPDPIASVQSLTIDGQTIIASPDGVQSGYLIGTGPEDGLLYLIGYCFNRGRQNIVLSWTGGWTTVPAAVAQACIEMVALDLTQRTRQGIQSQTLANETVTYVLSGMTPSIKQALMPYAGMAPL